LTNKHLHQLETEQQAKRELEAAKRSAELALDELRNERESLEAEVKRREQFNKQLQNELKVIHTELEDHQQNQEILEGARSQVEEEMESVKEKFFEERKKTLQMEARIKQLEKEVAQKAAELEAVSDAKISVDNLRKSILLIATQLNLFHEVLTKEKIQDLT